MTKKINIIEEYGIEKGSEIKFQFFVGETKYLTGFFILKEKIYYKKNNISYTYSEKENCIKPVKYIHPDSEIVVIKSMNIIPWYWFKFIQDEKYRSKENLIKTFENSLKEI